MSCEEIICIENIVDIQATYYIMNLKLSDLIEDILSEMQEGVLPILEIRLFLHSLKDVPFTNEDKGQYILNKMDECMENQLYLEQEKWTTDRIMKNIIALQRLILWDYIITGSIIVYYNHEIQWDVNTNFILNKGKVEIYNCVGN